MNLLVRVALVGGDERYGSVCPPGMEIRQFGSSRSRGNGSLRRVLAAIGTGGLDAVVVLVSWIGHPASEAVRDACRRARIPCSFVTGGETAARRALRHIGDGA
jgi:hypothetical protein